MPAADRKAARALWALLAAGCVAMALVEGVWRPSYWAKAVMKAGVFCLLALAGGRICRRPLRALFPLPARRWLPAAMAGAVFAGIWGVFWLLLPWLDLGQIAGQLLAKEGVDGGNFAPVALYICLVNSLLEELFFRGLGFLLLRQHAGGQAAAWGSSLCFSLYHVTILEGWFSPLLTALAIAGLWVGGLLFCWLDREGGLLPSWGVHMAANLGINTIGLWMFAQLG